MARYRIVEALTWTEGGELAADDHGTPTIVGGEEVTHERGAIVELRDDELGGIEHHLEPVDDAARAALERAARVKLEPASTGIGNNRARRWLDRAADERSPLRRVMGMIERGDDPTDDDLAAALQSGDPPERVLRYIAGRLRGTQRKVGRKKRASSPPRSTAEDLAIAAAFRAALARQGAVRQPRTAAYEKVAADFGLSIRTVQQVVLDVEKRRLG